MAPLWTPPLLTGVWVRVTVLAVGKLRDRGLERLCEGYTRRASRHLPVRVVEVADDARALRRITPEARVVGLDARGKSRDSEAFARWLGDWMTYGRAELVFVVGGARGISQELRRRADETLSLGPMTLPHRLARVVLLEQIYRALSILRGEPYHK